jgi:hypothetical protein
MMFMMSPLEFLQNRLILVMFMVRRLVFVLMVFMMLVVRGFEFELVMFVVLMVRPLVFEFVMFVVAGGLQFPLELPLHFELAFAKNARSLAHFAGIAQSGPRF